jgi:hypothetical protein
MSEFERIKLKLSKCKDENIILNAQIQTLKIENKILKISGELRYIATLDRELVYGTRMSHDKSGIEFDKDYFLSNSKPSYIKRETISTYF